MHAGVLPASWGSVDAFPQLTTLIISDTNITGRLSTLQIHALITVNLGMLSCHKLLWVPCTQQWISAASGSAEASCKESTTGDTYSLQETLKSSGSCKSVVLHCSCISEVFAHRSDKCQARSLSHDLAAFAHTRNEVGHSCTQVLVHS